VPDGASDARIHVALINQACHVWRASEPLHSVEAFELRLLSPLKPDALFAILVGRFGGFKHSVPNLRDLGPQWSAPCCTGAAAVLHREPAKQEGCLRAWLRTRLRKQTAVHTLKLKGFR
jgi:hypothetical protein